MLKTADDSSYGEADAKSKQTKGATKIPNYSQHSRRLQGIGLLGLSTIEIACCIGMPFLFVPVGIFAFANSIIGIILLVPYFDRNSQQVQKINYNVSKFLNNVPKFFNIVKKIALILLGVGLCFGASFCAPITTLLATFGVACALSIKVGLMAYGVCGLIAKVAPRLPRNLWIFFKNGIISLIPGICKGSFGKAIAISRQEIEYRNENDTVEGFDINKVISPQLGTSDVINSDENYLQ